MMIPSSVEPLTTGRQGPTCFPVLTVTFHLEQLERADAARLEHALDLVWDWIGGELRFATLSAAEEGEPARRQHLEYVSCYPTTLEGPSVDGPSMQFEANNHAKVGRTDYAVKLSGATDDETASPFSVSFWAEIGTVSRTDRWLPALSTLTVTVPETWPLADFQARALAIASSLRLRWGAAGYGYSAVFLGTESESARAIYAHARRHPGYDVGYHVRCTQALHDRLRTVSWLTFVGPALEDELGRLGRPIAAAGHVDVARTGHAWALRAGPQPLRGDVNRLDVPAAYREADAMVRPVRANDAPGLVFLGRWRDHEIREWLRRFEQRVV